MNLEILLDTLEEKELIGRGDVDVSGITSNSNQVEPGHCFVAIRGSRADGHRFLEDAIARGAAVCIIESMPAPLSVPAVIVPDTAKALALLAARFYGNPADDLWLCGVTGTNGKTSTVHLLRSICEASAWGSVGIIGTVGHGTGGALEPAVHTTPDAVKLHQLFSEMKDSGCRGVVMEVSSHAIRQQRTYGVDYVVGILTNVTHDHLDYHKTFEDYAAAKREFCFSLAGPHRRRAPGVLVYFAGDAVANSIGAAFAGETVSVGLSDSCDVYADDLVADLRGTRFTIRFGRTAGVPVTLPLLGRFSAYNALLAAAAAHHMGIEKEDIKRGLEALRRVPGRFETFGGGDKPLAVVDYSHTPDSLERVLRFCLDLKPRRLITVFGCGGDRDKEKRPVMGRIARQHSHRAYVTSDNPRTEDPAAIIDEILAGMDVDGGEVVVEPDRRRAIAAAIANAAAGDLVAICGKGHEDYQIIGTIRHHFDDREEAVAALEAWGDG